MDHAYIEEHQVVDRYLMNQLEPEEKTRFEDHYVHCQNCLDQLELAERFQRGFKRAAAQDVSRVAVAQQLGLVAWLTRLGPGYQAAMLTALLAVALLPAILAYRDLGKARSALQEIRSPHVNTAVVTLNPERGRSQGRLEPTHRVRLSGVPEWIVLSLELDGPEHERYRVTLLRGGEIETWQSDGLVPDHLDALVVSFHSTWLEAGDYVARVEALMSSGPPLNVAHFSFRVIASD